ncbi:hypothetical protein [Novosphingobium sp.]|uniref:hypothetical protein n=1 Tax=Novosphingobium sp. TaxID=1874826 RepID=UPI00262CDF5E|nr:hypothetical protein [Novosphingobium sp.]
MVWLLGQPHLDDYLDFHRRKVIHEGPIDLRALAAEWQVANDVYYELEQAEAGLCETIECRPLPDNLVPLAEDVEAHPWFRSSFDDLPYCFEAVELDKLIVSQLQVEHGHSARLAQGLTPGETDDAALFRFCLPLERDLPPCRVRRLGSNRYEFTSYSSDFREHQLRLLRGQDLAGLDLEGPVVAMLGLPIGFGSNFLSCVRSGQRVLLQNGYHRAYALRCAGFTHAWAVVETVTRKDELRLTASEEVLDNPEFYFAARRPPLLKDFFDPRLGRRFRARRSEFVVEVEVKVRSGSGMILGTE